MEIAVNSRIFFSPSPVGGSAGMMFSLPIHGEYSYNLSISEWEAGV